MAWYPRPRKILQWNLQKHLVQGIERSISSAIEWVIFDGDIRYDVGWRWNHTIPTNRAAMIQFVERLLIAFLIMTALMGSFTIVVLVLELTWVTVMVMIMA